MWWGPATGLFFRLSSFLGSKFFRFFWEEVFYFFVGRKFEEGSFLVFWGGSFLVFFFLGFSLSEGSFFLVFWRRKFFLVFWRR